MKISSIDLNQNGSTKVQTDNRRSFLKVAGASLVAASVASVVEAASGDERQGISLPLGSTSLVFGQSLRTTLTNVGTRRISVQPSFVGADGTIVKQAEEPLILEPDHMCSFEVSRNQLGGRERSMLLRTELAVRREDLRSLWITSEVLADATGQILYVVISIIGILVG